MSVEVFINFNGNCREAVEFYAEVFGREKPEIMCFRDISTDSEFPLTEETKNLVMYTCLNLNGSNFMFSDIPPHMPFSSGNNMNLVINSNNTDEIVSLFNKLKEGGSVNMELQETFWSECSGAIIDRFGLGWQFNYDADVIL